ASQHVVIVPVLDGGEARARADDHGEPRKEAHDRDREGIDAAVTHGAGEYTPRGDLDPRSPRRAQFGATVRECFVLSALGRSANTDSGIRMEPYIAGSRRRRDWSAVAFGGVEGAPRSGRNEPPDRAHRDHELADGQADDAREAPVDTLDEHGRPALNGVASRLVSPFAARDVCRDLARRKSTEGDARGDRLGMREVRARIGRRQGEARRHLVRRAREPLEPWRAAPGSRSSIPRASSSSHGLPRSPPSGATTIVSATSTPFAAPRSFRRTASSFARVTRST